MRAELIDHMGSDLTVVNAARVSFDKTSEYNYKCTGGHDLCSISYADSSCPYCERGLSDADSRLIRYLARHNHFTPFTHPQITMRERVPVFVARQRFKHCVGFSYNEVSRRYVDAEPDFWEPYNEVWKQPVYRKKTPSKKQGSSDEIVDPNKKTLWYSDAGETSQKDIAWIFDYAVQVCEAAYEKAIYEFDMCPEQARMVLPQSMYTEYYVTGSLAAWARAYNLRSQEDAQSEIRDLAAMWNTIIEPMFPVSWKALTERNGNA